MPAVERQQRQQVQERERHAHEPEDLKVVAEARRWSACWRGADDADRARQLAPLLRVEEAPNRLPVPVTSQQCSRPFRGALDGIRDEMLGAGAKPQIQRPSLATSSSAGRARWRPGAVDGDGDRLPVARANELGERVEGRPCFAPSRRRSCRPPSGRRPRPACSLDTAPTSVVAVFDGAPVANTTKKMTNATRMFASGPAEMTAMRFHVGWRQYASPPVPSSSSRSARFAAARRRGQHVSSSTREARAAQRARRRSPRRRARGGRAASTE